MSCLASCHVLSSLKPFSVEFLSHDIRNTYRHSTLLLWETVDDPRLELPRLLVVEVVLYQRCDILNGPGLPFLSSHLQLVHLSIPDHHCLISLTSYFRFVLLKLERNHLGDCIPSWWRISPAGDVGDIRLSLTFLSLTSHPGGGGGSQCHEGNSWEVLPQWIQLLVVWPEFFSRLRRWE